MPSARRRTNLAHQPTSFVGRASDLRALEERLSGGARLVSVLGPPGVGKTRLASRYAELFADRYKEGGVWLCDLAEITGVEGICRSVGQALGVPLLDAAAEDLIDRLGAALEGRGRTLLLLDNFEHVAEHAAATIGAWIGRAKDTQFLTTSRQRLELKGEILYDLAPLSLSGEGASPEAVELFIERARAVRADLCLARRDEEVALDIVQKLDGIPLAIELAAARMRVLSLSQLCKKLGQSLSALATGPRGASARHATLTSAIEWSWNLLAPWEQGALAQCSVFRGGFSLEAAAEVLDLSAHADAPEPLDVLASLRDKSLLVTYAPADAEDELRFGLYGSIRDYAGERLSGMAAKEAACARHAACYLCAFREPTAISRLALEQGNLLAVHQRAVAGEGGPEDRAERALGAVLALQPLLLERGPSSFYLSLLDSAIDLARASPRDRELTARAHVARGEARRVRGFLPQARADYEEAITLARGAGARQLELSALVGVGVLIGLTEGASAACAFLQGVRDAAREANDRLSEVRAISNIGMFEVLQGLSTGRDHLEEGHRIFRELGDRAREGFALENLGCLALEDGRIEDAKVCFEQAIALLSAEGKRWSVAVTLRYLGDGYLEQQRFDDAARCLEEARDVHRELGDRSQEHLDLVVLVRLRATQDDIEGAEAALRAASANGDPTADHVTLALVELGAGHLDLALSRKAAAEGDLAAAAAHRESALRRIRRALSPGPLVSASTFSVTALSCDVRLSLRSLERAFAAEPRAFAPADERGPRSGALLAPTAAAPTAAAPAAAPSALEAEPPEGALLMTEEARRFRPPRGKWVDFERRRAPRLILKELIEQRLKAPGEPLTREALVAAGWPGEAMATESAASRVYVALTTLRREGLKELLQSRDDGYLLDPAVAVVVIKKPIL